MIKLITINVSNQSSMTPDNIAGIIMGIYILMGIFAITTSFKMINWRLKKRQLIKDCNNFFNYYFDDLKSFIGIYNMLMIMILIVSAIVYTGVFIGKLASL